MTSRKHPSAAFWATVVVVAVLVGYPLSFGPWCWITSRSGDSRRTIPTVYRPIMKVWDASEIAGRGISWYAALLARSGWALYYGTTTEAGTQWRWGPPDLAM